MDIKKLKKLVSVIILCLLVISIGEAQSTELSSQINKLLKKYNVDSSKIGIAIYSTKTEKWLYEKNAKKSFILASNTKLFTTSCALMKLGPDFNFSTKVYYNGAISTDGVLNGNISIIGGADPNISARFQNDNSVAIFQDWTAQLKKLGVKKIEGDIVLDDSMFDSEYINPDWVKHDLAEWWVAPVSALSLNDNCIDITVEATKNEEKALIKVSPDTKYITIINKIKTKAKPREKIAFSRKNAANEITIWGEIEVGTTYKFSVAIHHPTMFFGMVFKETLEKNGVIVNGEIKIKKISDEKEAPKLLAEFKSDILRTITVANKVSQNFYAECLLKYLGYKFKDEGSSKNGASVINEFLKEIKIDEIEIKDGSGVSRGDMASPEQICELLNYMRTCKYGKHFIDSLAVGGAQEGTLKYRFNEEQFKGKITGKSGSLSRVANLSGYIDAENGDCIIFSILSNDKNGNNKLLDAIAKILITYK